MKSCIMLKQYSNRSKISQMAIMKMNRVIRSPRIKVRAPSLFVSNLTLLNNDYSQVSESS